MNSRTANSEWNHRPELPLQVSPVFQWPPQLLKILRWYWFSWFPLSEKLIVLCTAMISWFWLQPSLEFVQNSSSFIWIIPMWLRNLALMTIVTGGLHAYFYIFKVQGDRGRYDPRDLSKRKNFTFNRQVWDNMFWTLASGVTVWTAYEALYIWLYAHGHLSMLLWAENPIWFAMLFLLIPVWESFYFYFAHRFLHWPPLYRLAHKVHHRNINLGPWSGLSMHPIEHVLCLGAVLIHLVVTSHPVHILYHMQYLAISASTTHTGFQSLRVRNRDFWSLGTFHHQMHHRYFECNYGSLDIPWDKFWGSWHDGTTESHTRFMQRRKSVKAANTKNRR